MGRIDIIFIIQKLKCGSTYLPGHRVASRWTGCEACQLWTHPSSNHGIVQKRRERSSLFQSGHSTEEKGKIIAAVWGKEVIPFLAALAILPRTILKNKMNSSFSFKSSWCNSSYSSNSSEQNSKCGKGLNKFCPPNRCDDLCLFFCLYLFLWIKKIQYFIKYIWHKYSFFKVPWEACHSCRLAL